MTMSCFILDLSAKAATPESLPGAKREIFPELAGSCAETDATCTWEWVIGGLLDRRGKVVWQQTIGGPLTEKVFGIESTADGGVVIVGKTYSIVAGISQQRTACDSKSSIARLDRLAKAQQRSGQQGGLGRRGHRGWRRGCGLRRAVRRSGQKQGAACALSRGWRGRLVAPARRTKLGPANRRDHDARGCLLVADYTTGRGAGYQDVWVMRLDHHGRLKRH